MKNPFKRDTSKSAAEDIVAYVGIYDHSINIPQLYGIRRKHLLKNVFFYETPEIDADGFPILKEDKTPKTKLVGLNYTRPFIIAMKKSHLLYFLCREGSDTCEDPEYLYREYFIEGSHIGLTIETMARLAEIDANMSGGFSLAKHPAWVLLMIGFGIAVGVAISAFFYHPPPPPPPAPPAVTQAAQMMVAFLRGN